MRYHHDVKFKHAVDMMSAMIERGMLTTEDIAQAAVLAAQIYAERHRAPITIVIDDRR